MNFKRIILFLFSLTTYSSVYSMDKDLTEKQIQQVTEYQNKEKAIAKKKSRNENLAKLAGLMTAFGTYKMVPVEYFFEKYKVANPAWETWNSLQSNPFILLFFFPLWIAHNYSQPNKHIYQPESIKNTINALKVLIGIASLYAGYKTYKVVKNKLEAQIIDKV